MASETGPWHAAYPKPKNTDPQSISRSEVLKRLDNGEEPGRDFLLVDLRRSDHEVRLGLGIVAANG
jgi:arsenical-resistance protein 2